MSQAGIFIKKCPDFNDYMHIMTFNIIEASFPVALLIISVIINSETIFVEKKKGQRSCTYGLNKFSSL